ncbi:unnamed protein product [Rotaria sordida]|uniref:Uncharacterized protein n=2 Tax=Rotaria sordida TaxID=392033 RepID=A0A813TNZ8_9BILA|nr:unnamed protein product [Rotaria sordida]CAF0813962.1 unnamed protein product [Rotaria sordida]
MAFFSRNPLCTSTKENEDPKPPKIVEKLQTEINQLNIEWGQAFKDQSQENQKLRDQLQEYQTFKEKHLQDIQDIVEILIDGMITRIERDTGGEKRELLPDDGSEEGRPKKKARIN